jgi:hypothetical protein
MSFSKFKEFRDAVVDGPIAKQLEETNFKELAPDELI